MRNKLLLTLGLTFLGFALFAQVNITGNITDYESGDALPGVTVSVKGTDTGTLSDADGNYSIEAPSNGTLIFSFIGYITKEVQVNNQSSINVELESDAKIDEVIVVGYGFKKKSLVTGAISSVDADEFVSSVTRPEQVLQGKVAGVNIIPSSGAPGAGIKVRIRGAGSNGDAEPLYIVDGMKMGDINFLDPADIESVEVLKDAASSAIYGTEGANGVIMITTKSGKSGKAVVNYNFQYGVQSAPNLPELMNASEYITYMGEIYDPGNVIDGGASTDWYDATFENAPMMKHQVSISGGNDISTYYVSGGYLSQDGIAGGDKASFERITVRFNSTHKVKKWLEFGNNIAFSNFKRNTIEEDDGYDGVMNSMLMMDPTVAPTYSSGNLPQFMSDLIDGGSTLMTDGDGMYYGVSEWLEDGEIYNPLIRIAKAKNKYTDNKLAGAAYFKIKPFNGFDFTSRIGIDLAFQNYNSWTPSYYATTIRQSNAAAVSVDDFMWNTWLWENFASYTKTINKHDFTVLAGVSTQKYTYTNLETSAGTMVKEDDSFAYPSYASRDNDLIAGGFELQTQLSYFGRLSYSFDNKYLFEATIRRDGSSLFGTNNKWGTYPSVSAGWLISNESFWTVSKVSYLKLRASWGQNGSLSNLGVDNYKSLITSENIVYPDGSGTLIPGSEPDLLANPDLRWETSEQLDIGLDVTAFNDRIYANFDFFRKITKDLLTEAQPALSQGNDAPFDNAGDISNIGFEVNLGVRDKSKDFKYDINVNFTKVKNEVTFLNENVTRFGGGGLPTLGTLTYFEIGQPVWYYRGYETEGIFADQAQIDQWLIDNNITDAGYVPEPGDPIIVNHEDDGTISDEDMTYIGSPHPDIVLGANINLAYKGLDLNVFMQGAFGQENFIGFIRADRLDCNRLAYFYDERWTESNTNSTLPRADYADEKFFKSDLMVDNGSYLKIRQIQLGYTFPKSLSEKVFLSNVRLYVSLNDYFTFTKYKGLDPEVGSGDNNRQGVDFGYYPVSKKILFGIAVTF